MTKAKPTPPAKKRLIARISQDLPNLTKKEQNQTLRGIVRFVNVIKKIHTEPQAEITIKETMEEGKIVRTRNINFDYAEILKLKGASPRVDILETLTKAGSYYPEKNHARRRKSKI